MLPDIHPISFCCSKFSKFDARWERSKKQVRLKFVFIRLLVVLALAEHETPRTSSY